jgi:hypothetical protein
MTAPILQPASGVLGTGEDVPSKAVLRAVGASALACVRVRAVFVCATPRRGVLPSFGVGRQRSAGHPLRRFPMFGVVCFQADIEFDHSQGFPAEAAPREYVRSQPDDGCRYQMWNEGRRLA